MRYSEDYQVPFFMGTATGDISVADTVNIMMLVSEHQLDELNIGVAGLAEYGAGWVITQNQMEINRLPRVDERLHVWTEATSYNRLLCYRTYGIDDLDGNNIALIHSTWVMFDLQKRKIMPIIDAIAAPTGAVKSAKVERLPRVTKMGAADGARDYRVRYFDIDFNGHVNNVHYFDWLCDSLGNDWLQKNRPVSVNIKYEQEVGPDDTTTAAFQHVQDTGTTTTLHRITTGDVVNAIAEISWTPLQK